MIGSDLENSFIALLVVCGVIGAAIMAVLLWLVPWLWSLVKPMLHAVTG